MFIATLILDGIDDFVCKKTTQKYSSHSVKKVIKRREWNVDESNQPTTLTHARTHTGHTLAVKPTRKRGVTMRTRVCNAPKLKGANVKYKRHVRSVRGRARSNVIVF